MGCEALYGLSYLFTKGATANASALALLGWRSLVAVTFMGLLVAMGVVRLDLKGKPLKALLLPALFFPCIYFVGETMGISLTTASESGAFLACIPVASLVASTLLLGERPSRRQVVGVLVTLAGVFVTVFAVGAASSLSVPGYAFLLLAVVSYALYSVFAEKAARYGGTELTFVMLLSSAALFVPLALLEAALTGTLGKLVTLPLHNLGFLSAVLYQGIGCSVVAFFLINAALAKIGVNRTASFVGISTVVSIVAGMLVLGEPFTLRQAVGAAVIIAGVYIAGGGS